jgi:hypothetical protein
VPGRRASGLDGISLVVQDEHKRHTIGRAVPTSIYVSRSVPWDMILWR